MFYCTNTKKDRIPAPPTKTKYESIQGYKPTNNLTAESVHTQVHKSVRLVRGKQWPNPVAPTPNVWDEKARTDWPNRTTDTHYTRHTDKQMCKDLICFCFKVARPQRSGNIRKSCFAGPTDYVIVTRKTRKHSVKECTHCHYVKLANISFLITVNCW